MPIGEDIIPIKIKKALIDKIKNENYDIEYNIKYGHLILTMCNVYTIINIWVDNNSISVFLKCKNDGTEKHICGLCTPLIDNNVSLIKIVHICQKILAQNNSLTENYYEINQLLNSSSKKYLKTVEDHNSRIFAIMKYIKKYCELYHIKYHTKSTKYNETIISLQRYTKNILEISICGIGDIYINPVLLNHAEFKCITSQKNFENNFSKYIDNMIQLITLDRNCHSLKKLPKSEEISLCIASCEKQYQDLYNIFLNISKNQKIQII